MTEKALHILELKDNDYPNYCKISIDVNKKANKWKEFSQNGRYYNFIQTINVPSDSNYKEVIRKLTIKVPMKGRMKYNYVFEKNKLDEVIDALTKLNNR